MATSIIRDQTNNIILGRFCIFGGVSGNNSGGGVFTPIEITPSTTFPSAGGVAAFKVPNDDYRFSMNINGDDIVGTLNELLFTLYDNYGIHTSYTTGSDVIFTDSGNSLENNHEIAIKGVLPPVDNLFLYNDSDFCQHLDQGNGVLTFTLTKTRDYALLPLIQNDVSSVDLIELDDVLNYTVYNKPIDSVAAQTVVNMTPWYLNSSTSEIATRSTIIHFNQPSALDVTFGEVIDNHETETEFNYRFVYRNAVMATLSKSLSGINEWSSNTYEFRTDGSYWFDFKAEPTRNPFIIKKGFSPFLGQPS